MYTWDTGEGLMGRFTRSICGWLDEGEIVALTPMVVVWPVTWITEFEPASEIDTGASRVIWQLQASSKQENRSA
jgi:hypothetical protein